eukprot:CAMPEP_0185808858 /NCGR_PEP_ID=MMETSP1322-20130828/5861_1 /TAXON_ID=265543 /ORGANISM="Minutocellus polymorphus, Strain RCC2270" /LENGTH=34 /DNA_ID= /DNA_START= /DNA_END= /DNA_ORIENTATION=
MDEAGESDARDVPAAAVHALDVPDGLGRPGEVVR